MVDYKEIAINEIHQTYCKDIPLRDLRSIIAELERKDIDWGLGGDVDWKTHCEEAWDKDTLWNHITKTPLEKKGAGFIDLEQLAKEVDQDEERRIDNLLNQRCGVIGVLELVYEGDPQGYWTTPKQKLFLKEKIRTNPTSQRDIFNVVEGECDSDESIRLGKKYFNELSKIEIEKIPVKAKPGKEIVVFKDKKGWITHIGGDKLATRVRESSLREVGFFEEYYPIPVREMKITGKGTELFYRPMSDVFGEEEPLRLRKPIRKPEFAVRKPEIPERYKERLKPLKPLKPLRIGKY